MFALVLAHVRDDYWTAPENSLAFQSAKQFIDGGECKHIECVKCGTRCDELGGYEMTEGVLKGLLYCAGVCGCGAEDHVVATYDWTEWSTFLIECMGIEAAGLKRALRVGKEMSRE